MWCFSRNTWDNSDAQTENDSSDVNQNKIHVTNPLCTHPNPESSVKTTFALIHARGLEKSLFSSVLRVSKWSQSSSRNTLALCLKCYLSNYVINDWLGINY